MVEGRREVGMTDPREPRAPQEPEAEIGNHSPGDGTRPPYWLLFVVCALLLPACGGSSTSKPVEEPCGPCAEGEECGLSLEEEPECCPTCEAMCEDYGYQCGEVFYDWCEVAGSTEGGCWCGDCSAGKVCVTLTCAGGADCELLGTACVFEEDACGEELCGPRQACTEQECVDD